MELINIEYMKACKPQILEATAIGLSKQNQKLIEQNKKLIQTLEQIREMVNKHLDAKEICYGYQVIDIIDEVLNV